MRRGSSRSSSISTRRASPHSSASSSSTRVPRLSSVTTPNSEYNVRFLSLPPGRMRHRDHRLNGRAKSSRSGQRGWLRRTAYTIRFLPIGGEDLRLVRRRRWRCSHDEHSVARVRTGPFSLERPARAKSTFARSTSSRLRCSPPTGAARRCPTTPTIRASTKDAFELLHYIAAKRLHAMKLTVVDATNVQRSRASR